jgi:hypothetical protein
MRKMMNVTDEPKNPTHAPGLHPSGDPAETIPMHPDDFEAHLAWITAKRFSEPVLKDSPAENYRNRFISTGFHRK